MSKDGKHHYIPIFYLKQWLGADRKLCEFKKRYGGVAPRRVYPDMTGYVHGLYTIDGLPPEIAQYLETHFFTIADTYAARAMQKLLAPPPWDFTNEEQSGWSRFIFSLAVRNPESVAKHEAAAAAHYREVLPAIEAKYAECRKPEDPPTYGEYVAQKKDNPAGRAAAMLLQKVIDSPKVGNWINQMYWMVLHDRRPDFLLLTSDRPLVMTNGIARQDTQLILPISPRHIFVATNNVETQNKIRDIFTRRQLVQQVNDRVAKQSRKFVYAYDDLQSQFVSTRLGLKYTADPLEHLSLEIPSERYTRLKAKLSAL